MGDGSVTEVRYILVLFDCCKLKVRKCMLQWCCVAFHSISVVKKKKKIARDRGMHHQCSRQGYSVRHMMVQQLLESREPPAPTRSVGIAVTAE
jgi:hypothetical protein